ncbi:ImmA/IrrE family metallo-endopeptidase [Streptococcus uberis]|uniref:ImmA/IrrE family metallo-endopeptidase n=1 Tax=Streptococcus uberis TaxID=1349 RepID=UPI0038925099
MSDLFYYDGRETDNKGFYDYEYDVIFINAYLDDIDKKKVLYHELGHVGQNLDHYNRMREKFELQADRNMIHHLLKEYLLTLDNIEEFNVCRFMETYKLKTICNEQMVVNEFKNLI